MTRQLVFTPVLVLVLSAAPASVRPAASAAREAAGTAPAPDSGAGAAVSRADLDAVTTELGRLRAEVAALRSELAAIRTAAPVPSAAVAAPAALARASVQPEPPGTSVETLRAQVDELSQTKVESTSRMPVRLFGAIVSNTVGNSGMANWLENPNIAESEIPGQQAGSFTSTLRQSQIGLNVGPIPMGSWTATGAMVADFFGGTPGFVTGTVFGLPRLVYAVARLEHGGSSVVVGQGTNLLAPRDPTSLASQAFPLLFRSGNLYLRSPQVRVEQAFGGFVVKGGIAAPLAADATNFYVFAPTAGAGERSGRPAVEGRAEYTSGTADTSSEFTLGGSVRQAWREPGLAIQSAFSYSADFNLRLGRVGVAGEYFTTDDAAEFGGAVAQARPAQGGWLEGRLRLTSKISTNAGVGTDEVDDPVPSGARSQNRSAFGNVIFDLSPEVAVSMEYRWLETTIGQAIKRTNNHVNAAFVLRF